MTITAPAKMPAPPATAPDRPNLVIGVIASNAPAIARTAKPISPTLTPVCLVMANMVIRPLSGAMAVVLPPDGTRGSPRRARYRLGEFYDRSVADTIWPRAAPGRVSNQGGKDA